MINLKQILMVLGNRLVHERKFVPSSAVNSQLSRLKNEASIGGDEAKRRYLRALSSSDEELSTRPITEFTEWLNKTHDAQELLFELGVRWPMTSEDLKAREVYDRYNKKIVAGDILDVQAAGHHKVYEIGGELVFCPYGKPDLVRAYFRNDIVKVEE